MSDGIENTIGWGQGSDNNDIGWGQAQEAWCEITPSSPATVKNSDESYNTTVAAGGTLSLPDITVTDSDGSTFTAPSVQDITCTPSAAPVGATLMKTGQTTSYRTGDDGDLEAGRATSFTVLASNNPFGNTNRFTDELGGQTYTNNIVIDWSTYNGSNVLGYRRTPSATTVNWNNAIDGAVAVSIGSYTTGWRLTNIRELMNIVYFENGNGTFTSLLQYPPFNIIDDLWSSTNLNTQPNFAWYLGGNNQRNLILYEGKGNFYKYIPCRTFTVTGTTLT